jgi:hypothetical protein
VNLGVARCVEAGWYAVSTARWSTSLENLDGLRLPETASMAADGPVPPVH